MNAQQIAEFPFQTLASTYADRWRAICRHEPSAHLTVASLADYFEHTLSDDEEANIERHVAHCDDCATLARRLRQLSALCERWTAAAHSRAHYTAKPEEPSKPTLTKPRPRPVHSAISITRAPTFPLNASRVKVILRNHRTDLYFLGPNMWTNDPKRALNFNHTLPALRVANQANLNNMELIVSLAGVQDRLRLPAVRSPS